MSKFYKTIFKDRPIESKTDLMQTDLLLQMELEVCIFIDLITPTTRKRNWFSNMGTGKENVYQN